MREAGRGAVTIRKGRPSDVAALTDIEVRCFRSYYLDHRFSAEDFDRLLRDPRTLTLVAAARRDVIGYILGHAPVPGHRQSARIDSVALLKDWRGRGVATRLVQRFLALSRRRGCRRIHLEVGARNWDARTLFTQAQFRPYRRLPGYYGDAADAVRLRKVLA